MTKTYKTVSSPFPRVRSHLGLPRVGLLACVLALGGCSFIAVEDINPEMTTDPAECAALNADPTLATGDACRTWQLVDGFCRIESRDTDGDGAKDPECAQSDEVVDCDVEDPTRSPALAEICDGVDNDCDDVVDEDTLSASAPAATQVATGADNVSFAAPSASARALAFFTSPGGSPQNVLTTARYAQPGSASVAVTDTGLTAPPRDGTTGGTSAAAAIDSQSYVGAFVPAGGCRVVVLGTLSTDSAATDLAIPSGHGAQGLPDTAGEQCENAVDPALLRARTPALAASPTRVLAAWVAGSFIDTCGLPSEAAPVVVNGAAFNSVTRALSPSTTNALSLGTSYDASAPAVVSAGGDRFVVAHADGSEAVLSLVSVSAAGEVSLLDSTRSDVGGGADVGDLTLLMLDTTRVALAFRRGCGTQARVFVSTVALNGDANLFVGTPAAPLAADDADGTQRRPRMARREFPAGATLLFDVSDTLRVRQLSSTGAPIGAAFTAYEASGALRDGQFVYALPDAPVFGVVVAERSAGSAATLQSFELSCPAAR